MPSSFSPELITAIFAGVGGLLTATLGFSYKIWRDHNKMIKEMNEKLLKMTEKNSSSNEKLSQAMFKVSETVTENTRATAASTDTLSKLMLELIRNK